MDTRSLLTLAWRYRALFAIVAVGLATLIWAVVDRILPSDPFGALAVGYLAYALGAGAATLALLFVVGPLLERLGR